MTSPKLRELREDLLRLSVEEFAQLLGGIPTSKIEQWESGFQTPDLNLQQKLTRLMKVAYNSKWAEGFRVAAKSGPLVALGEAIYEVREPELLSAGGAEFAALTAKYLK